jgi:hypothetical protein
MVESNIVKLKTHQTVTHATDKLKQTTKTRDQQRPTAGNMRSNQGSACGSRDERPVLKVQN